MIQEKNGSCFLEIQESKLAEASCGCQKKIVRLTHSERDKERQSEREQLRRKQKEIE